MSQYNQSNQKRNQQLMHYPDDGSNIEDNHMYKKPNLTKLYFELSPKHSRMSRMENANEILKNYYQNEYKNRYCNNNQNNKKIHKFKRQLDYPYIATKMNEIYKRITKPTSFSSLSNDSFNKMLPSVQTPTQKHNLFSTEVKHTKRNKSPDPIEKKQSHNKSNSFNNPLIFKKRLILNITNFPSKLNNKLRMNNLIPMNSFENAIKFTQLKPIISREENKKKIKDYEMFSVMAFYYRRKD